MNRHTRVALILLVAVAAVAWAQPALADGGPHGSYTATTDSCAGCHRTHTASNPSLLSDSNTALCLTCHGSGATGADTNVMDGTYGGTTMGAQNGGLNSGGFANSKQDTGMTGTAISGPSTSLHRVQGMPGYSGTATMWGAGPSGSSGTSFDLYCTSCHDPHGSPNYRMLKTNVNGIAVTVSPTDEGSKSYTTPKYYKPTTGSGQWEISTFCAACHTRYMATGSDSGDTATSDPVFKFEHRIDAPSGAGVGGTTYSFPANLALPVSTVNGGPPTTSPDNRSMTCLTCHYSHGSKAVMGTNSGGVPWPGSTSAQNSNARSSLLRLDNRGVCQNCHPR